MLAQNFKAPSDLGVTDIEFESLVKVLGMLERAEIDKEFNMKLWLIERGVDCGTSACIAGWAYLVSGRKAFADIVKDNQWRDDSSLWELLHPDIRIANAANRQSGAIALRNFLTFGHAQWADAIAQ